MYVYPWMCACVCASLHTQVCTGEGGFQNARCAVVRLSVARTETPLPALLEQTIEFLVAPLPPRFLFRLPRACRGSIISNQ